MSLSHRETKEPSPLDRLNHVELNYVNRALDNQYGFPLHGYIVINGNIPFVHVPQACLPKKSSLKKEHVKTVFFGWSPMYASFHVSSELMKAVNEQMFSSTSIQRLKELEGMKFDTASAFFQKYFENRRIPPETKEALVYEDPRIVMRSINRRSTELRQTIQLLSDKVKKSDAKEAKKAEAVQDLKILEARQYIAPLNEMKELIRLNSEIHGREGCVFQMDPESAFCVEDRKAFEQRDRVNMLKHPYTRLSALTLFDFLQQQSLYQRFIEDRMRVGFYEKKKEEIPAVRTSDIMRRLVTFVKMPSDNNHFEANCNKSTSSVLQAVEDEEVMRTHRKGKKIFSPFFLAFGSGQRMFLWNSPFHREIVNLFINRDYKKEDPILRREYDPEFLQMMADNKYTILQIVQTWPLDQQRRALEQFLDKDTPFGRVAHMQRSGTYRTPDPSRGFLNQVAVQLEQVCKELGRVDLESLDRWENLTNPGSP